MCNGIASFLHDLLSILNVSYEIFPKLLILGGALIDDVAEDTLDSMSKCIAESSTAG